MSALSGFGEFRFSCQRCSACCTGSPGAVWLVEGEPERLALRLGLDIASFISKYCIWIGSGDSARLSLREKEDWDCVFLGPEGCEVYEDRPLQCKAYPFWDSLVSDARAWNEESRYCPGIGRGEPADQASVSSLLELQKASRPWSWRLRNETP